MKWFIAISGVFLMVFVLLVVVLINKPTPRKEYRANIRTFHYGCKRYMNIKGAAVGSGARVRFVVKHPRVWKQYRRMECKI